MQPLSTMTKRLLTNYILLSESAVSSEGLLCLKAHANKYFAFVKMRTHTLKKEERQRRILKCTLAHLVPRCLMSIYLDDLQLRKAK